ncbi:MAG: hypothetical protein EON91_07230 [Brevundimonas sp.]|uniref:hypothetical protein n=1 Tax=Brevundimonas sp. TaxID=1871086 RepID=UPI001225E2AB|nr:hypothetical protein [Brevundimonas sp.]RZJ17921.1 MAG: hypothetical protein EON91_07230 [Brevundimonas sp.]
MPASNEVGWPAKLTLLGRCLLQGLFWTPLYVFAPAGLLQFMGMRPTASPIFLIVALAFPVAMAATLYARTRAGHETVEDVVERWTTNVGQTVSSVGRSLGGCALALIALAAMLFIGLGMVGLLVFGIRQIL